MTGDLDKTTERVSAALQDATADVEWPERLDLPVVVTELDLWAADDRQWTRGSRQSWVSLLDDLLAALKPLGTHTRDAASVPALQREAEACRGTLDPANKLQALARGADEPPSTLAAQFVRGGVAQAAEAGKVRPLGRAPVIARPASSAERAHWLEPWGGDAARRADMWGQIVALHGRYPRALASVKQGWWNEEEHVEALGALAAWRAQLDDAGVNPREELIFRSHLLDYAAQLRQEGGGVARAWKPGPPPDEWAGRRVPG